MTSRARAAACAVALLLVTSRAAAEPAPIEPPGTFLRIKAPATVMRGGLVLRELPAGYFLDDDAYSALDAELRRLQDRETHLAAENAHLRKAIDEEWAPGWKLIVGTALVGIGWGAWASSKLRD